MDMSMGLRNIMGFVAIVWDNEIWKGYAEFQKKFGKRISLTCVNEGLTDNNEAIIVFVYVLEYTPELLVYHMKFISNFINIHFIKILCLAFVLAVQVTDVCTFGGSFQNTEELDKKCLSDFGRDLKMEIQTHNQSY
ncbi:6118_t:CDS:2 [Funneliformis caledonium]|uniref:6118_t:CDS:1 n=1 Tax=Funneliformis caledonium TaxID=1117310 RepID=A0A9N9BE31_9GLOM|nr:6118_t:CDS:2 [Funneliformis caledonium]